MYSIYVRTYNFRYIKVKNNPIEVFFCSCAIVPGYLLYTKLTIQCKFQNYNVESKFCVKFYYVTVHCVAYN